MPAFKPIVGSNPQILLLGSMPSQQSLAQQQYYAHPQNAFWWIMESILLADSEQQQGLQSYSQRCQMMLANRVAVWDVLADCERPGSLDSSIVRSSERPNDFASFFQQHPTIRLIGFNGGAAKAMFMRHCAAVMSPYSDLSLSQLPSSSPAHAALSRQQKLLKWKTSLAPYL